MPEATDDAIRRLPDSRLQSRPWVCWQGRMVVLSIHGQGDTRPSSMSGT
jgi:hypothetical protein